MRARSLSHVRFFTTPWTAASQAPLSLGIFQARILEWGAMPSSRGSSWPRNQTFISYVSCTGQRFFTASITWKPEVFTPSLEAELEMLCLGASKPFWCLWCWTHGVWIGHCPIWGIVQYQKNFKRLSPYQQGTSWLQEQSIHGTIQKKSSHCPHLLFVQPEGWQLVFILPVQGSGVNKFIEKSSRNH